MSYPRRFLKVYDFALRVYPCFQTVWHSSQKGRLVEGFYESKIVNIGTITLEQSRFLDDDSSKKILVLQRLGL